MAWFRSSAGHTTGQHQIGVLLINLGTPTAPEVGPVRRYLSEFLGDRRVVEACPWYWYPILHGPILRFRPKKTAALYRSVWTEQGSPLLVHSKGLANALAARLSAETSISVHLAMTYGEPSLEAAIAAVQDIGVEKLVVLPLYPQYSGTTTGAAFDAFARSMMRWRRIPEISFISDYHSHPSYIRALADSVRAIWREHGRSHLVMSNHGIPVKYVDAGDPYRDQIFTTGRLLVAQLGLADSEYSFCFQSRFGPTEWLQPYTDDRLAELAGSGVRAVTVVTPSFAVDCLETLEEIAVVSREKFLAAGGESFHLVPALNATQAHVNVLAEIIAERGVPVPG